MGQITTTTELDDLIAEIEAGRCSFLGYQQPFAMIAEGNEVHDVPIGHLIPRLMQSAARNPQSGDRQATTAANELPHAEQGSPPP